MKELSDEGKKILEKIYKEIDSRDDIKNKEESKKFIRIFLMVAETMREYDERKEKVFKKVAEKLDVEKWEILMRFYDFMDQIYFDIYPDYDFYDKRRKIDSGLRRCIAEAFRLMAKAGLFKIEHDDGGRWVSGRLLDWEDVEKEVK